MDTPAVILARPLQPGVLPDDDGGAADTEARHGLRQSLHTTGHFVNLSLDFRPGRGSSQYLIVGEKIGPDVLPQPV